MEIVIEKERPEEEVILPSSATPVYHSPAQLRPVLVIDPTNAVVISNTHLLLIALGAVALGYWAGHKGLLGELNPFQSAYDAVIEATSSSSSSLPLAESVVAVL